MRNFRVLFLVPLLLLLATGVAYAAFDNSHHDLRSYAAQTEGCFHCHGRTDTNNLGAQTANFGNVGGLCLARCHSGTGILAASGTLVPVPAPSVDPATYNTNTPAQDYTVVYFTRSHGRSKANLTLNGTAINLAGSPAATWPYMQNNTTPPDIECTSCHAVHDNQNAPFLWYPLAASGTNTRDGFCDRCHTGRSTNSLQGAPDGNHPVDFAVDNAVSAARTGNGRHGRRIVLQKYGSGGTVPIFDIANPAASALIGAPGTNWSMGGHLTSGVNAAQVNWTVSPSTQQMGCYTCHAAHRTTVNGENNLVVVQNFDAATGWNPLCVGCHGASTTRAQDIVEIGVGTTIWGHEVGANTDGTPGTAPYTSSVGGFQFLIANPTFTQPQNGNQFGNQGEIMCTTCHKVHGGVAGSMSIANLGQGTQAVCKRCHTGVGIPNLNDFSKTGSTATGHNVANSHHVTRGTFAAGTVAQANETLNANLTINNPSWRNTGTGLGDYATGMDCADCHTFNNTAHNW